MTPRPFLTIHNALIVIIINEARLPPASVKTAPRDGTAALGPEDHRVLSGGLRHRVVVPRLRFGFGLGFRV